MHPLVKDLLRRICYLKRDHYDVAYYMKAVHRELDKNRHLTDEADIRKAVAYGRWMIREEQGRVRFEKYRTLKKRYYENNSQGPNLKPSVFNINAELERLNCPDE